MVVISLICFLTGTAQSRKWWLFHNTTNVPYYLDMGKFFEIASALYLISFELLEFYESKVNIAIFHYLNNRPVA